MCSRICIFRTKGKYIGQIYIKAGYPRFMRLEIELIPRHSWYKSLRNAVSKEEWDALRKQVYKNADYTCEICGASERLYCHEVWMFDSCSNRQRLNGFKALCEHCHYVKHLGLVNVKILSGELPAEFMEILINHFCKVNNCDIGSFEKHRDEVSKIWLERSNMHWAIDFRNWKEVIKRNQLTLENYK